MGVAITWGDGSITRTRDELDAADTDMNHIPDVAMTIAMATLFAKGTIMLRNTYNWRVEETDRLLATATRLHEVDAGVEEGHDFIYIVLPATL